MEETKFCTNCGQKISTQVKFCPFCGAIQNTEENDFSNETAENSTLKNQSVSQGQANNGSSSSEKMISPNESHENDSASNTFASKSFAATKDALNKVFEFSGRTSQTDYWYAQVGLTVIAILGFIPIFIPIIGVILMTLIYVALAIVSIALSIRRFHDTNRSGGYYCLIFIPFIGGPVLQVFMAESGNEYINQFGPEPVSLT